MATRIDKAVGAPVEMTLNKIKWTVSPLRFRDLGEYRAWLRQRVMTETMSAVALLSPSEQASVGPMAMQAAQDPSPNALETRGAGPEADLYLAWLSLRKALPDISMDEVEDQLPDLNDIQAIASKAAELSGGDTMHSGEKAVDFHFESLCRLLAGKFGFTPQEVADLTPYQAEMMLSKGQHTISWQEARQLLKD